MRNCPNIYTLEELRKAADGRVSVRTANGSYPARPLGFQSPWSRIKIAWLVFTGKADAVVWPHD